MARNRTKKKTLVKQIEEIFNSKLTIGESKKNDKPIYARDENGKILKDTNGNKIYIQKDLTLNKIYSWDTYKSYMKHANYFAKWCREKYKINDIKKAKQYVNEYLQERIDADLSTYTVKLDAQALAKLYGCRATDFIKTPSRERAKITRSREVAARDKHFSETKNKNLITFCKCTGLRRAELKQIRGTDLINNNGKYYLKITCNTKGGRERISPIVGSEQEIKTVLNLLYEAKEDKVFSKVHSAADIHSYRSEYCTRVYKLHARPITEITNKREIYHCKKDLSGTHYDKRAMKIASEALGHSRISVIAEHYLRNL